MRLHSHLLCTALCLLALALALTAPGNPGAAVKTSTAAEHSVTDATGHKVPCGLDAQRIVSLAPNLTEMVCAVGLGRRLAGRTDFCNYPAEVLALPTVGGFVDTSLEKIIALAPDLVVASQGNSLELVEQLRQAGIMVLALKEPQSVAEIVEQMNAIRLVAGVAADPSRPAPIISTLRHRLDELRRTRPEVKGHEKPVVFFGYPGENTLTCGGSSFLDDVIRLAGGVNPAHDVDGRWPVVSAEFLVAANPDWILTATPCAGADDINEAKVKLLDELRTDRVWNSLTAVKQGNVLVLDADVLLRPGPRIIDAINELEAALSQPEAGASGAQP